jgi:hypothetical protein
MHAARRRGGHPRRPAAAAVSFDKALSSGRGFIFMQAESAFFLLASDA